MVCIVLLRESVCSISLISPREGGSLCLTALPSFACGRRASVGAPTPLSRTKGSKYLLPSLYIMSADALPCIRWICICVLPLSPLIVLSPSFFPACYPLFCAPVVCSFVYTCVYSCVPTCTLLYTRVYTEAFITTSFRGSLLLYGWALVYSTNGLSSARQQGRCQLGGRTPLSCMEGLVPTLWIAFSLRCGGLLSPSSPHPYK